MRVGVIVGLKVRVAVGRGVREGTGVLVGQGVRVGIGVLLGVIDGVGVSVGRGVGGSPSTLKRPETLNWVPTKICTSYSPTFH